MGTVMGPAPSDRPLSGLSSPSDPAWQAAYSASIAAGDSPDVAQQKANAAQGGVVLGGQVIAPGSDLVGGGGGVASLAGAAGGVASNSDTTPGQAALNTAGVTNSNNPLSALGAVGGVLGGLGSSGTLPQADRDALQASIANTGATSNFYGQQMVNYQPVAAPVAQSPAAIQAAIAQQTAPIMAGQAMQQPAVIAQQVQAAQIAAAQQAQAAQVARTQLAPAATAAPTTIAPATTASSTQLAPTALASAATIDPTQQAQFRAQQQGLSGSLQDTIAGKNPSVAALMLRNATDNSVANQYALAQAANGLGGGQAQRLAMINSAGLNQQEIYQQALLRAQEIATAQGQLGGVLDQGRNADVALASQQAGLQQQTALANQSATNTASQTQLTADVQTKLANAGFVNTQNMNQAQLSQALRLANAGFVNSAATTQAQLDSADAQLQAQLGTNTSQFNAGQTNTQALNQAQLSQAAQLANQQASLNAGTTNATLGQQAAIANANNTTSANTSSAQLANAVNLANAQNQSQANLTTGQLQTQTNLANANNAVSTNALNQKATQDLAGNQLTASGQNVTATNNQAQADVGLASAAAQAKGAELNAGATAIAGLSKLSDRREKRDVSKSEREIAAFVRSFSPYGWRYKRPELPGAGAGRQYGVMAQDLERTKVGRTLVRQRPDGRKEVDVAGAATVALAAISALNKRIDRAEAR